MLPLHRLGWRLAYYTTSDFVCQGVFQKFFEIFSIFFPDWSTLSATAPLLYHNSIRLSTPFLKKSRKILEFYFSFFSSAKTTFSIRKSKIVARYKWYGYSVEFQGQNRKGVPYQKIANILNYGTSYVKGTRFINKAIRNLKDMDDRIYERFKNKIKE